MTKRAVDLSFFLLRVVSGFLFFQAGSVKTFGWFGGVPGGVGPPLTSQLGIGGVIEVVGGLAIALGLYTRPVAFLVSGQMAVAYWQFHAPHGRWPTQNHGTTAALLCFVFLYFAAAGAGDLSLDALLAKRTARAKA